LDVAKPGDRIFAVAYGSGAGCDGFDITVTENISHFKLDAAPTIQQLIERKKMIDYATYAKYRRKIMMKEGGE
jgi:hydroxymethylglutaryl-CoA synthase